MKIQKYGTAGDIDELLAVRDSVDNLVNAHVAASPLGVRADLYDVGDAYLALIEVPGVEQADLEIAVQGEELLVAGLRNGPLNDLVAVFTERPVGAFQRTIRLPGEVVAENATAHLSNGVLSLTLPKA